MFCQGVLKIETKTEKSESLPIRVNAENSVSDLPESNNIVVDDLPTNANIVPNQVIDFSNILGNGEYNDSVSTIDLYKQYLKDTDPFFYISKSTFIKKIENSIADYVLNLPTIKQSGVRRRCKDGSGSFGVRLEKRRYDMDYYDSIIVHRLGNGTLYFTITNLYCKFCI